MVPPYRRWRPVRLGTVHFLMAGAMFLGLMLVGFAINVSVRLALWYIPLPDPLPFFVWAMGWYVLLLGLEWVAEGWRG